jgi:exopolyphosphatase/guanosine-5'-triphosphate,3'-diphosphate pyrophosphatase
MEITRLGQELQKTGIIAEKSMRNTLDCLERFDSIIKKYETAKYRVVGTNALREAANSREFIEKAWADLGIKIDIISGDDEAWLSYHGVHNKNPFIHNPLVIDLGGGSTEFICKNEAVNLVKSIPLGAVKATEKNLSLEDMLFILNDLAPWRDRISRLSAVFCGGTATTLAAIHLQMKNYDPDLINGQVLLYHQIELLYHQLQGLPLEQRKEIIGLQPERADIICAGVLFVLAIMKYLHKDQIVVSDADLLEGIISTLV